MVSVARDRLSLKEESHSQQFGGSTGNRSERATAFS